MYAFVDLPFSPSGVTHLLRRHRTVGFEKELRELAEVLRTVKEGNNNVLAVVIAPYGWGKSELLDELETLAEGEGFDVYRTALSLEEDFAIEVASKKRDKPMLVLIDEADELSRIVAVHKLGALSDDRFVKVVQKVATYIRALLEPRSYRYLLGEPERFNKVAIVAALTPQLYYTILKNVVPDVFDLTSGRVYREVVIDTRFPFWQFVELVKQRLLAYSDDERIREIERGELDQLSPFSIHELSAVYHLAKRRGEAAPRPLLKLMARLFQIKKEGGRLARLLREEGFDLDVDDEILELAFAAIPVKYKKPYLKEVHLYRIPFEDKDAMSVAREYVAARGKELDIKDPKNISYEPYLYYSLVEGGRLFLYLIAEEDLALERYSLGRGYIVSEDVAKLVGWEEAQAIAAVAKEYSQRLENPIALLEEAERALSLEGIRLRRCCGYALWNNNMGLREAYLFLYIDREEELRKISEELSEVATQGVLNGYVVDYLNVFVVSRVLLTDTIQQALAPLMTAYWKRHFRDPVSKFATVEIYGADKYEKLKQEIVKYVIDKLLKRGEKPPEFVDAVRLGREKARENILKYTIALRKGREKKIVALVKAAEALDGGGDVEGLRSYREIEEILLSAFEESIHEKELKSLIATLFPVNLWREMREEDLIELMKLRGVVVPLGERLYKYRDDLAKRYISDILRQLEALREVRVEKPTPLGPVKLVKKMDIGELKTSIADRQDYAKALREAVLKLHEAREMYEKVKEELEREAEEKARLLRRISTVLDKYPQRRKFIDLGRLDENTIRREESIVQKAEEALKIWGGVRQMASAVGSRLDVERDLKLLLELPEPWLDDYVAALKIYAAEIEKRYGALMELERARKAALEWLRAKLGIEEEDLDKALDIAAAKTGVRRKLLESVARRGRGAVLDVDELAKESGVEKEEVERDLEKLYKARVIEKKYVA
ncbi:hypothetical protein ODS41_00975 [Pyrobaculum sp. 3827-6]|uniref:hypothetical protein n=1 Tax=Pyrobaculum sp. 3827-6 TaxID=2983604 RepID=UPI0021DA7090|nr:hypothetical protein [Pyrobaculum sp. 3827-6]MCU7786504.1 hypothetical protein [Pyrobaculum sp. 3827-6]